MKLKRRNSMIYIRKRRTPAEIEEKAEKIKKTLGSTYEKLSLPEDTNQLRTLFDQMPKDEIRENLYKEQHGLCAYCMRRITDQRSDTKIEHYKALSTNKETALDYQNYLGVCYGGEKEKFEKTDEENHKNTGCMCCDASRGEQELTINPWNRRRMEAIGYYKKSGEIFVRSNVGLGTELVNAMQKDIDDVLHLNGEKDLDGKIKWDTRSKLVASRRSVCDSVCSQFDRWGNKGVLTADFLQDKIDKLESQLQGNNIADEYIGVRLYLYKRKAEKLRKQR